MTRNAISLAAILKSVACVGLLLTLVLPVQAQVTTASISGKVIDQNGSALYGANITAVHEPTGSFYGAVSRDDGRFNLTNLRIGGPYTVKVAFIGYQTQQQADIFLKLGQNLFIEFTTPEETLAGEEVVIIAERNAVLGASTMGAGKNIASESIQDLPTISRSFQDFARLSPQVVGTSIGNSTNLGGINIAGKNNRYNNVQLDGAPLNDVFGLAASGTPGGQANTTPISLDAIDEFQVSVSPYDVRQGGFTGGLINAVTRSGTNKWDGSVYYFGRDDGFLNEELDGDKSKLDNFNEFQSGFRLGGPLMKDKAFLFLNGEVKQREDPLSANITDPTGNKFANISQGEIDDVIEISKDKYGYDPGDATPFSRETNDKKLFVRFDYNLSQNHKLTLRHSYNDAGLDAGIIRDDREVGLTSQNYEFGSKTNSTVFQVNSTFGPSMANEFRLSFTTVRDKRSPSSAPFSEIEIQLGDNLSFGQERFSQANSLDQDIIGITDNFNYFWGDHAFTVGLQAELFSFDNLFIQDFYGRWVFDDVFGYVNGNGDTLDLDPIEAYEEGVPERYSYSYALDANGDPTDGKPRAKFDARQIGVYVQDEWRVTPDINLNLGVRADVTMLPDDPLFNPLVETEFGLRTDEVPSSIFLISPRFGFNWDVMGDRSTQVRGGLGLFAGRTPAVWISNQYSNTGVDLARVDAFSNVPDFVSDPFNQPVPGGGNSLVPITTAQINITDKDFKMPQVMRANISVDHQLPWDLIGSVEFVYTKNLEDVAFRNINLDQADSALTVTMPEDGRPFYQTPVGGDAPKISNSFTELLIIENSSEGFQHHTTLQIQKASGSGEGLLRNVFGNVAYTYSRAEDVNSGTSSRAISNWQFNLTDGDPNKAKSGTSNYEIRHRFLANASYRVKDGLFGYPTTLGVYYEGRSGRPFSYIYNGDGNGDGRFSNDLVFVPANESDINLTSGNWDDLDAFIEADDGLKDARGGIADRNSSREPWVNQLDIHFGQVLFNRKNQKIELTVEALNFLNWLNSEWGVQKYMLFGTYSLLELEDGGNTAFADADRNGYEDGTGKPIVSFDTPQGSKFTKDDLLSRYQIQLGLRYSF